MYRVLFTLRYSHSAAHMVFHVVSESGDASTKLVPAVRGRVVWVCGPRVDESWRLIALRSVDNFGNANRLRKDVDIQIVVKCV